MLPEGIEWHSDVMDQEMEEIEKEVGNDEQEDPITGFKLTRNKLRITSTKVLNDVKELKERVRKR